MDGPIQIFSQLEPLFVLTFHDLSRHSSPCFTLIQMYTLHIRVLELEIYFFVLVKIQSVPTTLLVKMVEFALFH